VLFALTLGVYQGSIQLVGLVGTYQEGLAYLQQQQQAQQECLPGLDHQAKPAGLALNVLTAAVANDAGITSTSDSCSSFCIDDDEQPRLQLPSDVIQSMHCLLLSVTSDEDSSSAAEATSSSSSSNLQDAAAKTAVGHHSSGSSSSMSSSDWCVDLSAGPTTAHAAAAPAGEEELCVTPAPVAGTLCPAAASAQAVEQPPAVAPAASAAAPQAAGKVIMWLGSSIGNSTRDEAAAFLRQLKEAAMQPGRQLGGDQGCPSNALVGFDCRIQMLSIPFLMQQHCSQHQQPATTWLG
jgi:hypothetical protein